MHRRIAAGGMATVHLGRLLGAAGFSRTVAVKRLHDGYARDPEFVAMLLDEARLASQIRHPNVVPTLDVVAEQDELLVVMEYITGDSLAHLAKLVHLRGDKFPIPLAAAVVAQALHGLHAAHDATDSHGDPLGIVHRDVSPQNVLVGTDGVARVLDFGIAKAASRATATEDGQIKGKTAYMAPEQLQHAAVDRRTDVWAAGVMFWELLTGRRLFLADSPAATIGRVLSGPIDSPTRYRPDCPPELTLICARALERDKEVRFETAEEMALAIEDAIQAPRPKEIGAWVQEIAADTLRERAQLVREVEREDTPQLSHSTTDPALRAALDEAERRRNMADLPTDMGRPAGGSGAFGAVMGPPTPRGPATTNMGAVMGPPATTNMGAVMGPPATTNTATMNTGAVMGPPTPRTSVTAVTGVLPEPSAPRSTMADTPSALSSRPVAAFSGTEVTDLASVRRSENNFVVPPPRGSSLSILLGVIGGLLLAGIVTGGVLFMRGRFAAKPPEPDTTITATATVTAPPAVSDPPAEAEPIELPATPSAPPSVASVASVTPKKPRTPPRPPPAPKGPDCRVPYTIDGAGNRHIRPECVH